MKLYYGSVEVVEFPRILDSQRLLDFGRGYYTTTSKEQAENWALIKIRRVRENAKPIVSVYEIADKLLENEDYNVKVFVKADVEWLDFIILNRTGNQRHPYDIVKGAVANDTLYTTLLLYETGVLSKTETIARLKVHKLFDQISFHNEGVLKELRFIESYEV